MLLRGLSSFLCVMSGLIVGTNILAPSSFGKDDEEVIQESIQELNAFVPPKEGWSCSGKVRDKNKLLVELDCRHGTSTSCKFPYYIVSGPPRSVEYSYVDQEDGRDVRHECSGPMSIPANVNGIPLQTMASYFNIYCFTPSSEKLPVGMSLMSCESTWVTPLKP